MNLNELKGVKRYQDLDLQQLMDVFTSRGGYKHLAQGRMANVFKTPNKPEVLKVWANDAAYEHFVELAISWSKNKHMPRFLTPVKELTVFHKRTSVMPPKLKYIRMEELHEADHFTFDGHEYPIELLTDELEEHYSYDDELLDDVKSWLDMAYAETNIAPGPELSFYAHTAFAMIHEMDKLGAQPDFYHRNLMQRSDGTAVITDPGGFGEEMTMSEFIRGIEDKHAKAKPGSTHSAMLPTGSKRAAYRIVKGPSRESDYYKVADSL